MDTETGVVTVLKNIHVYEVGKAISPLMCKGQINGGAAMGIGMAFSRARSPLASMEHAADGFGDYVIATAADMPADEQVPLLRCRIRNYPLVQKAFPRCLQRGHPAITAAIDDAVGVWINEFPLTPEVVLRALESKKR